MHYRFEEEKHRSPIDTERCVTPNMAHPEPLHSLSRCVNSAACPASCRSGCRKWSRCCLYKRATWFPNSATLLLSPTRIRCTWVTVWTCSLHMCLCARIVLNDARKMPTSSFVSIVAYKLSLIQLNPCHSTRSVAKTTCWIPCNTLCVHEMLKIFTCDANTYRRAKRQSNGSALRADAESGDSHEVWFSSSKASRLPFSVAAERASKGRYSSWCADIQ